MTRLTKCLLIIALTGLITGGMVDFSGLDLDPHFTVLLPLGAVFLVLFIISLLLEKAMAEFNKEEAEKMHLAQTHLSQSRHKLDSAPVAGRSHVLQPH